MPQASLVAAGVGKVGAKPLGCQFDDLLAALKRTEYSQELIAAYVHAGSHNTASVTLLESRA